MARKTFLKRQRPGALIIGIILLAIGITVGVFFIFLNYEVIWMILLLIPGIAVIVAGIIRIKTISAHNAAVRSDALNYNYVTNCVHCQRPLSVKITDFIIHRRNFPEGYVDCPFCKQHVSKNAFTQVKANSLLDK